MDEKGCDIGGDMEHLILAFVLFCFALTMFGSWNRTQHK